MEKTESSKGIQPNTPRNSGRGIKPKDKSYKDLYDFAPVGYFTLDWDGTITQANQTGARQLGGDHESRVGKDFIKFLNLDNQLAFQEFIKKVIASQTQQSIQVTIKSEGHETLWLQLEAIAVADGQEIYLVANNITGLKQVEAASQNRNQLLLSLHNVNMELGAELRLPDLFSSIMKQAQSMLGADRGGGIYLYEPAEDIIRLQYGTGINQGRDGITLRSDQGVAGRVFRTSQSMVVDDYTHWDERVNLMVPDPPSTVMGVPLTLNTAVIGALLLVANSTLRKFNQQDVQQAELFAAQASIGIRNAKLYQQAQQEISERIRVEQVLRDVEDRFKYVFDYSAAGKSITLPSGEIQVNKAFCDMLGYSTEELQGKTWQEISHPDDIEMTQKEINALIASEKEATTFTKRYFRKTGDVIWADVSTSLRRDHEGKPLYFMTTLIDITERKKAEEKIRRQNRELTALTRTGQAFSHLMNPAEIVDLLYANVGQVLENRNFYVALYDEASQMISFPEYTINGEHLGFASRPFGNGLTEYVLRSKVPVFISGNVKAFLDEHNIDLIGTLSRSYLGVPLQIGEHMLGAIAIQDYAQENIYDAGHVELLSTLASQAAIALENARLYDAVRKELDERKRVEQELRLSEQTARRTAERLQMVNQIGTNITSGLNFEQLNQTIFKQCQTIGETDTFFIALYDNTTERLSFPFFYKDGEYREVATRNLKENSGLVGYVIESRQTLYIPDQSNIPAGIVPIRQPGLTTQAFIGVPLILNDRVVGALSMQSYTPNAYSPEQIQALELLATQVAIAIQNSQLFGQVQVEKNLANALIDNLPGGFCLVNQQGQVVRWNNYAETILGYSTQEIMNLDFLTLFPKEEQTKLGELFNQVFRGGQASIDTVLLTKNNGQKIPIYATGTSVQIGNESCMSFIGLDITERKRAEGLIAEQLDELQRWYDATLGREDRILELKEEVNQLLAQTGQPPHYPSAEAENQ